MQLIAIDGVSIKVPADTPANTVMTVSGNRFTVIDCPSAGASTTPVCLKDLIMMPSARRAVDQLSQCGRSCGATADRLHSSATFKQGLINLGGAGEAWPEFKLAKVEFASPTTGKGAVEVAGKADDALSPSGTVRTAIARPTAPSDASCRALAPGHRRRIFFGMVDPTDADSKFGLGYEEVDQNGAAVAGTQVPVSAFDPDKTTVCLPLGATSVVHEIWELVNLATEIHNFHIHQTKFRVSKRQRWRRRSLPPPRRSWQSRRTTSRCHLRRRPKSPTLRTSRTAIAP